MISENCCAFIVPNYNEKTSNSRHTHRRQSYGNFSYAEQFCYINFSILQAPLCQNAKDWLIADNGMRANTCLNSANV